MKDTLRPNNPKQILFERIGDPILQKATMPEVDPCDALLSFNAKNPTHELNVVKVIRDPKMMPLGRTSCAMSAIVDADGASNISGSASMTCTVCARVISITPTA